MAMTDSLTGAHNRRYFMNHMRRELKRTRRLGGDLSLLVFDIDHFKHINDRYGHAAGDDVLVEFVRRVQQCAAARVRLVRAHGRRGVRHGAAADRLAGARDGRREDPPRRGRRPDARPRPARSRSP